MATIEIYTKQTCPFCQRAKALFEQKRTDYQEIAIDNNSELRAIMIERSGRTTVPQVFINQQHIGGCDDLFALDQRGELDPLLKVY